MRNFKGIVASIKKVTHEVGNGSYTSEVSIKQYPKQMAVWAAKILYIEFAKLIERKIVCDW